MTIAFELIPVTHFQQNCSLLWCTNTLQAAVVDPGGDLQRITAAISGAGVEVNKILLTHGHMDHAGSSRALADQLGVPLVGPHRDDAFWLDMMPEQAQMMGFTPMPAVQPDYWLSHGECVEVGEQVLQVLHCPGHTPGHVVFFHQPQAVAWVGDVLFAGSIGRTDFARGDHDELLKSIRQQLWPLGDHVRFVPGHGPMSSFGKERRDNPFVADQPIG